jgi:hypothetical protein
LYSLPAPRLFPQEQRILGGLGGSPWTSDSYTRQSVTDAQKVWAELRRAVGFTTTSGWLTSDKTNSKLAKSGLPTYGVTLHAASNALDSWHATTPDAQAALAAAIGLSLGEIADGLRQSVCPRSTHACRATCVVAHSFNGELRRSKDTRLARTLLTLFRPTDAVALTAAGLSAAVAAYGVTGARWRVNISDDIRWELLAPGLWDLGSPLSYAYSKHVPADRPGTNRLRIVYSATERWTPADVAAHVRSGHSVAVIFDVKKRDDLPRSWAGLPVVNGDKTDDLWEHPHGVVVGLRSKGPTLAIRQEMRRAGFAFPPRVRRPLLLPVVP